MVIVSHKKCKMVEIELIIAVTTIILAGLEITQILLSWVIWCETMHTGEETRKARVSSELVRQETRDLQDAISDHHAQQTKTD